MTVGVRLKRKRYNVRTADLSDLYDDLSDRLSLSDEVEGFVYL